MSSWMRSQKPDSCFDEKTCSRFLHMSMQTRVELWISQRFIFLCLYCCFEVSHYRLFHAVFCPFISLGTQRSAGCSIFFQKLSRPSCRCSIIPRHHGCDEAVSSIFRRNEFQRPENSGDSLYSIESTRDACMISARLLDPFLRFTISHVTLKAPH